MSNNFPDGTTLLRFDDSTHSVPEHFHETYCITLVRRGTETMKLQSGQFFAGPGLISITHPNEVHANPQDGRLSTSTFYPHPELIRYATGGKDIVFDERTIASPRLVRDFEGLEAAAGRGELTEPATFHFLRQLARQGRIGRTAAFPQPEAKWQYLADYVTAKLTDKLTLEVLANLVDLNVYAFTREFRYRFGMSPMNYVLMRKAYSARTLIEKKHSFSEITYGLSFFDQAHFSRTFKRYVGLSPREFRRQTLIH